MPDVTAQIANKQVIASGDYKSADPAAVVVQKGAGNGIFVRVAPTLLSGAGCTVTATMTDADTGAALGTLVVTATGTFDKVFDSLPVNTHRVQIACVGSGTRTTLTYSVVVGFLHMTYAKQVYWDGAKYASSEAQLH